jgi:hypothetical protein
MAYDLIGLRNRVLDDKLDDTSYSPSVVDNFINDTIRDIAMTYELPAFEEKEDAAIASGSNTFVLPTGYQMAQAFVILSADGNVKKDIGDNYVPFREFIRSYPMAETNEEGAPTFWTSHGGIIYLDRPVDQNYTATLWYLRTPTTLVDTTDVPEIDETFSEIIILGAYYRVLQRNEDYDLAAANEQAYNSKLDKMMVRTTKREGTTPHIMNQPQRIPRRRRV